MIKRRPRIQIQSFSIHNFYGMLMNYRVYHNLSAFHNRQQRSPLLYSIGIWPARNSRLTQSETNHYITRCASVLAWSYLAFQKSADLRGKCAPSYVTFLTVSQKWQNLSDFDAYHHYGNVRSYPDCFEPLEAVRGQ